MNKKAKHIIFLILLPILLWSCGGSDSIADKETTVKGNIAIAIDQAFQPILEQQLKVWDSSYPNGKITPIYTTEQEAYRLLLEDTIRLIITSKDITEEQKAWGKSKKIVFSSMNIARAGYAVIVHPNSKDEKLTMGMLRSILSNEFVRKYKVVIDRSGSSTMNYIITDILQGQTFDTTNMFAAGSQEQVIDFVSKNPNSIGIVSINYIYKGSQNENRNAEFIDNVKIVALQGDNDKKGGFYEPYLGYLYTKEYPLTKDIYFVTKETWRGLGTGFVTFLCQPPGQMLFYKDWMVPLRSNIEFREAIIN